MNPQDPLQNLKSIHELAPLSGWPPAPGWWLLAVFSSLCLLWYRPKVYRYLQQRRQKRYYLQQLHQIAHRFNQHQNSAQTLDQIAHLLKRISIQQLGRHSVAALTGSAWLTFLDANLKHPCFARQLKHELTQLRYQSQPQKADIPHLIQACKHWIKQLNMTQSDTRC